MKIFDMLRRGKGRKQRVLPPIRTVRPPADVRAERLARRAKEFEESGAFEVADQPDDEYMDTGTLELQGEPDDVDDPYQTHTWEMDREEGLRRVDDLGNREKPQGTADNPYDTIVKKKGW